MCIVKCRMKEVIYIKKNRTMDVILHFGAAMFSISCEFSLLTLLLPLLRSSNHIPEVTSGVYWTLHLKFYFEQQFFPIMYF